MNGDVLLGLIIPFAGTALGSACVFLMKQELGALVQKALTDLMRKKCIVSWKQVANVACFFNFF